MISPVSLLRSCWPLLFFCVALTLSLTSPALAVPRWEAPDRVSQGRAFVVTVQDTKAHKGRKLPRLAVVWQGKTLPLTPVPVGKGGQGWAAQILLGVPLDAATGPKGRLPLKLICDGKTVSRTVEVLPVPWHQDRLSVAPRYVNPPKEVQSRIARDRKRTGRVLASFVPEQSWSLPFYRPVKGTVSASFGSRRVFNNQPRAPHRGTDLRGATGTPVHALAAGTVALAEDQYYSGNVVYVDHGQGVISVYAHLSAFDVKPGDRVERGQVIGKVGATGRVTGSHLHLGLLVQGVAVDAMPLCVSPLEVVGGPTPVTKRQPAKKGGAKP